MELVESIYRLAAKLPREEKYGLTAQLQRAAVSIPSNIAEGHSRESTKEYLRFLSIARGSLAELETQLMLCQRLGLLAEADIEAVLKLADEVGRMTHGVQTGLRGRLD